MENEVAGRVVEGWYPLVFTEEEVSITLLKYHKSQPTTNLLELESV